MKYAGGFGLNQKVYLVNVGQGGIYTPCPENLSNQLEDGYKLYILNSVNISKVQIILWTKT
jgi:hypothetical protein